jgi:hypothetical protein
MSENTLEASGGIAAPAENLKEKDIRASLEAAGMLVPEEQDLADALLDIVDKHGKFNADNTGVWAGYTSAKENAENAQIGVKCGSCIFWEAPNGCKIIVAETEEGGLCRFAVLPDGAVTAGLEKDSDDPCWDGYVQVGMKIKDGKEVPNCVPMDASNDRDWADYMLYEDLEELVSYFNSEVGPSRATELTVAEQVADRAAKKYATLATNEIANAIRWDLFGFLEYSSLGLTASAEFSDEYADLLPAGHPYNENPAVQDYASWISGAPGLDESSRDAIYASIAPSDDDVKTLHASTRVKTLIASGNLPEETVVQIKEAILWSLAQ